jgi:hypothetical protein
LLNEDTMLSASIWQAERCAVVGNGTRTWRW